MAMEGRQRATSRHDILGPATQLAPFGRLPKLVLVVFLSTAIALVGGDSPIGVPLSAIGWMLPLIIAGLVLIHAGNRVRFPVIFWTPWVCYVLAYLLFFFSNENALQRSIMLLTPLVVGAAISTCRVSDSELKLVVRLCKALAIWAFAIVMVVTGMLETGLLPETAGTAAASITACLLAALFATRFGYGNRLDIVWWLAMVAVPFIGVTRTAMAVTALCLVLAPAPMKVLHRLGSLVLIIAMGLVVFHSQRVQDKMFVSGEGQVWDMSLSNPDFLTSGRSFIIEELQADIEEAPWAGHGANASEAVVDELTMGLKHPHNDWLRFIYDYGYIGTALFCFGLIGQLVHALRRGLSAASEERIFFMASALSLVVQALIMLTDNVVLYAAFFGNLQFAILGLGYARAASRNAI